MANTNPIDDSQDFLTISGVASIPSTKRGFGDDDPDVWRPRVNAKHPGYDATVRLLPQGMEGLKNKTYPSVNVKYHHLYLNGVSREVKCRLTLPGTNRCPMCQAIWDRWREAKNLYGKDDPRTKAWLSMTSRDEWFTNVLIREDDNVSANNGQVKVWRHSDAMERQLRAPFDDSVDTTDTQNGQASQGGIRERKAKAKRHFFPHSPTDGVDFTIMATWDAKKKMPTYDGSDFEDASSPLADNRDEMIRIISSCHDLGKYLSDIPSDQESATIIREFLDEAAKNSTQKEDTGMEQAANQQARGSFMPSENQNYSRQEEPRTNKVNASDFFGGQAPAKQAQSGDDDLLNYASSKKAAQTESSANALPPGNDDDGGDDLPF